jgi:hypothetical protein
MTRLTVYDQKFLREHYRNRWNLVLDSICPDLAPHIVVTQAEETWNSQLTAWENRVEPQWMGNLLVPMLNTIWLPPPTEPSPDSTILQGRSLPPAEYTSNTTAIFNASKFNKLVRVSSASSKPVCSFHF